MTDLGQAIYFGNAHWRGNGGGSGGDPEGGGPWVGADLESGMYYGGGNVTVINTQNQPLPYDFVSLTLKGRTDGFMLKGGDATKGTQTTMFDGPRPFETAGSSSSSSVGARSGDDSAPVSLQKCTAGNKDQTWAFEKRQEEHRQQRPVLGHLELPNCQGLYDLGVPMRSA